MVGRLSTGAGVRHSETNAWSGGSGETRYVQMWVLPDAEGPPSYETADLSAALESGAFVAVASGTQPAPVTLRCNATLFVARVPAGSSVTLPASALVHLYVACGAVTLTDNSEQVQLLSEDAARLTNEGVARVEATADAELLAWAMA